MKDIERSDSESKMNGTEDSEIIVEDDDEPESQDKKASDHEAKNEPVFVKKKILNDDDWFEQISEKEMKYYKKHVLIDKELDESTVVCTACFRQVNHKHAGAVVRHPDLGVPICKQCKKFYHMGEWTRDEDGFFEYCRWCANGGDLLMCDSCSNAFCKKCIKRNLGRSKVTEIEEVEEWNCLACEPKQVWKQRSMYYSVWLYQKNLMATAEEKELKMRREAKTKFIEDTLKDGTDVNKILGNYIERARKSWTKKSQDYNTDDISKTVVKLRTIIKITHHNLKLLDKNLLTGCLSSFPGIKEEVLKSADIPDDDDSSKQHLNESQELNGGQDTECKDDEKMESKTAEQNVEIEMDNDDMPASSPEKKSTRKSKVLSEEMKNDSLIETPPEKNSDTEIIDNKTSEKSVDIDHKSDKSFDDDLDPNTSKDMFSNSENDEATQITKKKEFDLEKMETSTNNTTVESKINDQSDHVANEDDGPPDVNGNSESEGKAASEEDIDSEEANARARAAVLQTTSSESDQAKNVSPDCDEISPRKKLKTKKELDQMRRKSSGDDNKSLQEEKHESSEDEKQVTPKSKKKIKPVTSTPKPVNNYESESGSGKDLMGIDSDEDGGNVAKKKTKKGKSIKESSKSTKKSKKVSEPKSGDSNSSASDMDSDEKAYRRKQKKREKRNMKRIFEVLNDVAAKIDVNSSKQLAQETQVNIQYLNRDIKADLKEYDEVDIADHPSLKKASSAKSAQDRDIDRLCNFKSLKRSNASDDESGSDSDKDNDDSPKKKRAKQTEKKPKNVEKGLGDMSSNSDGEQETDKDTDEEKPEAAKSQNELAKAAVLASSSDDDNNDDEAEDATSEEEAEKPKPPVKEKPKTAKKSLKMDSDSDSESFKAKRKNKPALLSMKLSETDSSEDEAKYRRKLEKKAAEAKESVLKSEDSDDSSSDEPTSSAKKKNLSSKRKRIIDSDSDDDPSASEQSNEEEESDYEESDSSVDKKKKKKSRRKRSSSSDDSDSDRPKKKRKRIQGGSDSDDDKEEASPTKGRHDIRKIIKEKHLTEETKEAAANEKARRKRIEERQALYNKTFTLPEGKRDGENVTGQLVLDFDTETKDVLVEVNKKLVKKLKPHQINGVKFMWDACFESIEQIKAGVEGGAILAHCMGLGKTLQTITLTHTLLDHKKVRVARVMVICPVNTVKNWQDEYDKWLTGDLEVDVFEMSSEKDNWGRSDKLNQWYREGGVLIIGYEMFRNLVNEKNSKFKNKQRETFNRCLLDPGPDIVICDEGHLLKNEKSAINKAVNRIKTERRIVLTGTPLQNNLKEYYEMVNFVKPHLLGTRKEFMNRFVNPIVNGQHSDSTERDVRTMKKRSFILSDLLKGCMQRLDYNVLVPYLQPKQEYVISITLTDLQKKLYKYYLENYAKAGQIGSDGKLEGGKKGGLFYDVQNLSRIWNHPCILLLAKQRKDEKDDQDDEEGSLKDFINDEDEDSGRNSDSDSDIQELDSKGDTVAKKSTRSNKAEDLVDGLDGGAIGGKKGWWNSFLSEGEDLNDLQFGNKMVLLMDVLKESALIGDKVLVFSQSLLSLDLIEDFLSRINDAHEETNRKGDSSMSDYLDTWIPGKDYYRMDGSTAADTRKIWCKYFNKTTSHRMRLFLISTKAGGLGINLVAANRVIIFDASWNPSHDVQSIFRVFRFGQTKPVYIYRFLAKGTMEEKIYDRQVTKQSLSARVVDEQQIERHFTMNELSELYEFNDEPLSDRPIPAVPEDRLLAELVDKHKDLIWKINNHDSLLENQIDENLTEEERKSAWEEYEQEKKGRINTNVGLENSQQFGMMLQKMLPSTGAMSSTINNSINPMTIQAQLRQMNPDLSHEELVQRTRAAILQLQNMYRSPQQFMSMQSNVTSNPISSQNSISVNPVYQAEMARVKAMLNQQPPAMYRTNPHHPGVILPKSRPNTPTTNPHHPGSNLHMRRVAPAATNRSNEVITLDGEPETRPAPPSVVAASIRPASPASLMGGARGRGGASTSARGWHTPVSSGSKPNSGNES